MTPIEAARRFAVGVIRAPRSFSVEDVLLICPFSQPHQTQITIQTHSDEENDRVIIEIMDTGTGIAAGDLPFIFNRFYRGKQAGQSTIPGTGLGLAITKEIIERHGGSIEIQSQVDEGTTFYIYLPAIYTQTDLPNG